MTQPSPADPNERPKIATAALSLVLPAHNAAAHARELLAEWRTVLNKRKTDYEILVVDDGSTDETPTVVAEAAEKNQKVRLMRQESRLGFGDALKVGIAQAQHPLLAYCPLDRQYRPDDLPKLLAQIDTVDVVSACRAHLSPPQWARNLGLIYRMMSAILLGFSPEPARCWLGWSGWRRRWLARWVYGVALSDPESSFRLVRRELFQRIPIQSKGTFANIEILAKANFLGAYLAEEPVRYQPPETADAIGTEKPQRRDCWRVLAHPNFGPVDPTAPTVTETPASQEPIPPTATPPAATEPAPPPSTET